MKFVRQKLRESRNLVLAIGSAILFACLVGAIHLVDAARVHFNPESDRYMPGALYTSIVIWMCGVLWVAYRRWRQVLIPDRELEEIISGINPDAFLVIGTDRRIRMCNETTQTMFGYTPKELLGHTTDLLYYDRRPILDASHSIYEQLERLGFHIGLATGKHRDGRVIPLEIVTGTIRYRRGAVLLIRDISQRVQAEEAHREKAALLQKLESNYTQLQELERARDNLLHMIVHDMKSPLQVILGTCELLKEELTSGQRDLGMAYVDETLDHTQRLIEMVNSLLDVSRLEAGELPLNASNCDLRTIAKRAIASLSVLANGKTVKVDIPGEPVQVDCDPEIIRRVMVNLIANGIHHTPENAKINVVLRSNEKGVSVEVSDNGPGIPEEYHKKIFEKFAQVRGDRALRRSGSTGIGLTFCKLAVEAHGGAIGVRSAAGKGSTFWFSLPHHIAPRPEQGRVSDPASAGGVS